jgi:hypothetical protein
MRCFLPALLLMIVAFTQEHALAQVMQNMNYEQELQHAKSLLAGETATDISHHIHYDLKLYDRDNHQSTATYDIYRDPAMNQHVEIKASDYALMQIANLRDKKEWLHYTGDKPLKIADFEQALDFPRAAVDRFSEETSSVQTMEPEQLQGAPLLCANDNNGTAICFHPLIRLFAYAQMFNRTIMYDEWLPIGTHTVPGSIRIYEGKKLLVEATGTVETVNKFPEHFMEMPETPSQADPTTAHKAVRYQPIDASGASYGNTEIRVSADEKGQVTKADVIDSDDKRLEGVARKFARNIVFQPQVENGQPVPFTSVIYVEYYPRSADE